MEKEILNIDGEFDFSSYIGLDLEEKKKKDFIKLYRNRLKNQETFEQEFNIADNEGNLLYNEFGYEIRMNNKEIDGRKYNEYFRANRVKTYQVVVLYIDEAKRVITVSHQKAKLSEKTRLMQVLDDLICENKQVEVPAVVHRVFSNVVIIDIGGMGIPGIIRVKDWSVAYTAALRSKVKQGDVLQVVVTGRNCPGEERRKYFPKVQIRPYECSRRIILEKNKINPWLNIEERIKEGSIVTVKCEVKEEDKFFGVIDGFDEINVYCYYPKKTSNLKRKDIIPGMRYQCYVKTVSEEKKILRVNAFKCVDDIDAFLELRNAKVGE